MANSARSQLAEGIARALLGPEVIVASAGSAPSAVHPLAVSVMKEIGIDISAQFSKSVTSLNPATFELVVTLCADEVCPILPGTTKQLHWPLPDPAAPTTTVEEQKLNFRQIRDTLRRRIAELK